MRKRQLFALCLIFFSVLIMMSCRQDQKKPMNIVFIMADDHASRAISCYGSGLNQTPNIDKLADQGVRFTNACVTNSICGPSRATLLTGKYSHINGFMTNDNTFDGSQQTFPKLLQQAGYTTAIIGKWHLVSDPTGFDYWNILPGQGDYYNPDFIDNGKRVNEHGYVTDLITQKSIAWLRKQDKDKPFCLLVHHKAPHRNWLPSPKHLNDFQGVRFPVPANYFDEYSGRETTAGAQEMSIARDMADGYDLKLNVKGYPDSINNQGFDNWKSRMDAEQWAAWVKVYAPLNEDYYLQNPGGKELAEWKYQRYMHDYLSTVQSVDESVGEIVAYLKENDLYENTLIVYTSDQGFYTGEHGWFDKRFMYEESLLTPLIIHNPAAIQQKAVCASLVQNTDFAPTLLDIAGVKVPADMQGVSLKPLLVNPSKSVRDAVYYQYFEYPAIHSVKRHYGIRTDRYKLIHFYHDVDVWEFYDLKTDPGEMKNLISEVKSQETIANLKKQLEKLRHQYNVPALEDELKMGYKSVVNQAAGLEVKFTYPPSAKYSEGKNVLTDGIVKTLNAWHPGDMSGWQAIEGKDLEAIIIFEKPLYADTISINCLGHDAAWIVLPKEVVFEVSSDGKNYRKLKMYSFPYASYSNRKIVCYKAAAEKENFRFLKVKAVNMGVLPETHAAKGKPAWLFADEIVVK